MKSKDTREFKKRKLQMYKNLKEIITQSPEITIGYEFEEPQSTNADIKKYIPRKVKKYIVTIEV